MNNPTYQHAWNAHSIDPLMSCPYRYYLAVRQGWRKPSMVLETGRLIHLGLEHWDRWWLSQGGKFTDPTPGIYAALRVVIKEMYSDPKQAEKWARFSHKDHNRTPWSILRTIIWYIEEYQHSNVEPMNLPDGTAGVEVAFDIPLGITAPDGEEYRTRGSIDGIVAFDGTWGRERKHTVNSLGKRYFDRFDPAVQTDLYGLVLSAMLGDFMPIKGLFLEAIQLGVTFSRVMRYQLRRTPAHRAAFLKSVIWHIRGAEKMAEDEAAGVPLIEAWPQRFSACFLCDFRPICTKDPSKHLTFLRADYIQEDVDLDRGNTRI